MNMEKRNEIKVGDVVKSLDFVGINNCYYVGLVVGISDMDGTFRAKTIKRVWQGQLDKKIPSDFFTAPLPGNHFFDDMAEQKGRAARIQVVA
jgi:hypothetical protein